MPNRVCPAVSALAMLVFAGGAGALDMPPPAQDVLDSQRAAYEARGTKTILDLQPFRSAQSVDLPEGGAVTLISLNPAVRAWFLLELRGADGQTAVYHLENPDPARRGLALEAGTAPALVVGGDGGTETCTPWEGAPSALQEARDSGLPFAPLCGGALHLRNDVAGSRTSRERVAEFLRDNVWFGEEIVGLVKRTFYDDAFLRSGETRDDVDTTAKAVMEIAERNDTPLALRTGDIFRLAQFSRVRGKQTILYGSLDEKRLRQAQMLWGIHSATMAPGDDWSRRLMKSAGQDGPVTYAMWRGCDGVWAWEMGVEG